MIGAAAPARSSSAGGFTLVEVLVALVVFAVLGFAVTSRIGDVVSQTYTLERRTMAHWVAENHVQRLRIAQRGDREPAAIGRDRERLVMGGREWVVETEVQETASPLLRRLDVAVLAVDDGVEVGPVESITAFLGAE